LSDSSQLNKLHGAKKHNWHSKGMSTNEFIMHPDQKKQSFPE